MLYRARKKNEALYSKSCTSIFDQPVTITSMGDRMMEVENLAFLLNPMVCHVCFGSEARNLYCDLPSREDFYARGLAMDIDGLKGEIERLFKAGIVPITKQHLYRSRAGILEISLEVMDALWSQICPETKSMLERFQIYRLRNGIDLGRLSGVAEDCGRSGVEASLITENVMLKTFLARANVDAAKADYKLKTSQALLRNARRALSKSRQHRVHGNMLLRDCRNKSRGELPITFPDGSTFNPLLVENIAPDPYQERPVADKGKRDRFICFDWAMLYIKGNKQPRKDKDGNLIGGVEFTFDARVREMLHTMRMGVAAWSRSQMLRELALHDLVVQMKIVPTDRTKRFPVQGRPKMRLLNAPSRRLTMGNIVPAFQLQFFYYVDKLLNDPSTISVGVCGDGTHVGGNGVFGAVFGAYQRHKLLEDPLGNVLFVDTCRRFNGPLVRTANKFVKTMCDAHGNKFPPEAGLCMAKILWASNVATLFLSRPDMFALVFDGAAENTGEGGQWARDCLCGPNSIFDLILNNQSSWIHLLKLAEKAELLNVLNEFYEIKPDFPWPKAERDLGARLDTSGPVYRDMEVVKALDTYPQRIPNKYSNHLLKSLWTDDGKVSPFLLRKPQRKMRHCFVFWSSQTSRQWQVMPWRFRFKLGISLRFQVLWALWQAAICLGKQGFDRFLCWDIQRRFLLLSGAWENEHLKLGWASMVEVQGAKWFKQVKQHRQRMVGRMNKARILAGHRHRMELVNLSKKDGAWRNLRRGCEARPFQPARPGIKARAERHAVIGRLVSMEVNPCRFLPCVCQPDGSPLPVVSHCGCHRVDLSADDCIFCLNADILHQAVSFNKFIRCDYHFPQLKSAINHLLKRLKEGETRLDFYQKIIDRIDAAKVILRCHFDEDKGALMPVIVAMTRWGTTFAFLSSMHRTHPIWAAAVVPSFAHGPEHVLVNACVDILSEQGFDSDKYGEMKLEKCAERIFNFFTRESDILQMAIGHVLHLCVMQILLAAVSANHECGAPLSQGMESLVRAILLMFSRDFFVCIFPFGAWGKGWNRRAAIGCRTHGAEFNSAPSIRLLNPRCAEKVKVRLGEWPNMERLVDEASRAVPEYLETARRLARRKGPMLPEDSMHIWARCFPELAASEHLNTYGARMSQAQWLFRQVAEDVVASVIKRCQRELYHMFGFFANAGKTRKRNDTHTFATRAGSTTYQSEVLIPGPFSQANALVSLVQGRDLMDNYKEKGVSSENFLKVMPKAAAGFWGEEGKDQTMQFLGIDKDSDKAFLEYIAKNPDAGEKAENARFYRGSHIPDPSRDYAAGPEGSIDLKPYRYFQKTLSCYARISQHSGEANNTQTTSKPVEGGFSPLTIQTRGKGKIEFKSVSMIMQMRNPISAKIDMRSFEEKNHWKASEAVKSSGFVWFNGRDDEKAFEMRKEDMRSALPKRIQKGLVHNWKTTNHGGTSRSRKYGGVNPSSNTEVGKKLAKRIEKINERIRTGPGFEFKDPNCQGDDSQVEVGAKRKVGAAKQGNPAPKRRKTNTVAKVRVMASLNSAKIARRGTARPEVIDELTANKPARRAPAAGDTAKASRPCKKGRSQSSDELQDPDFSVGDGESAALGDLRRSARSRRADVHYCDSDAQAGPAADEEPPSQVDNSGESAEAVTTGVKTSVFCAAEVGARLEVYWEGGWGWSHCMVTAISNGKAQHPNRTDEYVAKGFAIVQYEAADPAQETMYVHNLDREHHFDVLGEKKFAWRELQHSEMIGEGGTLAVDEQPHRTRLQPGRLDRAQASAEHATGTQGGEQSKHADVDSSSSEESDESDDADAPREDRSKAPKETPMAVTCAVRVDSRVEVRWSDRQGGWSPCIVVEISNGRTKMPRNRSLCVVKGYAIVMYKPNWKCHHNLDQEHHVSRFGDRQWAWREPPCPEVSEAQKTRTTGKPKASTRSKPALSKTSVADTDDDNAPFIGLNAGLGDKVTSAGAFGGADGAAAPSGEGTAASGEGTAASSIAAAEPRSGGAGGSADNSSSSSAAAAIDSGVAESAPSHWSLSFCEKYFSPQTGIRRSMAVFDAGTYDVTRATLKSAERPNTVKISVVAGSGRMFYVAHSKETGPILINVKNVFPPCEGDWSQTLKCYRVFSARHASKRSVSPDDMICDKGGIESLGGSSLLAQAREDEKSSTQTYHCGDAHYWVDVRYVIGVVRWAPKAYRSADSAPEFSESYWSGIPEETDLIFVGQHFSQVK